MPVERIHFVDRQKVDVFLDEFLGHDSHIQHGARHLNRGVSSIRRQGTLQSEHTIFAYR